MYRILPFSLLWMTVACAQPQFPKPEPEKAFAELKVYDASGSPLRVPKEDWADARRRVAADESWTKWVAERRAEMDDWMARQQDHVEWQAGWWHDFVSEKDGSFLTWTPEVPSNVTPKLMRAWIFVFRNRNGEKILEAARLWRLTGERKYADWAAGQLDFYAGNYEKWPISTAMSKSRLMAQSLDDAAMLVRFVRAACTLGDFADAARRKQWSEKLFVPMGLLLDETKQRVNNIAGWQRSAMAQAALYAGDEELWKRAVDGPFGVRRQLEDGVTSDSLWLEQSLQYNSYVVSAFLPLFEQAALAGRLNELKREAAIAENLMLGPMALRFPGGKLPTPADSTGGFRKWPEMGILAQARRVMPTWLGLEAAAGQRSWESLIDPMEPVSRKPALPEVVSRSLESSRMAVLKSGGWQVYFHYGQLDYSHAQEEALNYEAFYGSTDVTHDAGTVGYGSPLHAGFYQKGAAHNVPLIDGQGQAKWNPGELVSFSATEVAARQPEYRPGVSAERRLKIDGDKLIDLTKVTTSDGAPHRIGLALHLQGVVELPANFEPDASFGLPYWSEPRTAHMGRQLRLVVHCGSERLSLLVETASPMKVTHAVTPDAPPGKREALYFEVTGTEAAFTTTLSPAR